VPGKRAGSYNERLASDQNAARAAGVRHILQVEEEEGGEEEEQGDSSAVDEADDGTGSHFSEEEKESSEGPHEEAEEDHEEEEHHEEEHEEEVEMEHGGAEELSRGKSLSSPQRQGPRNGKARVEHGRWVQTSENSGKWIFVAKAECPEGVCPGTLADENLRLLMDLDNAASDQDLYNSVMNSRNWNRLSDRGLRDAACRGHKHEVEFWCKGQAGTSGQMAVELDQYEQDWRQKAITRQKAKWAMLEYSKQRRAHEEEHVKAMATIEAAKELLAKKRQALLDEEQKVKEMEGKVKEALRASASQLSDGEEALKAKELEEMVAWQQMQNKRQLVVKFRALNKADIAEMIRQQREEDHDKQKSDRGRVHHD